MISENPLLAETTTIRLNDKLVNKNINPDITDKFYANLCFKLSSEHIDQSYILILDDTGYDYYNLADILYKEFKNDRQKRIILNYSRNNHQVDIRQENNISLANLDLASTSTFRDRSFNDKILDEAYEIFRLYTMINQGERVDNDSLWKNFLEYDFYNLKSCLRVALSIEYNIYMAGIEDDEHAFTNFYEKILRPSYQTNEITMRDILVDYEHHSWNRFMISQGYRIPSYEELISYAYMDQKGYVDYENKLHPLITNSNIKLIKEGKTDKIKDVSSSLDKLVRKKTIYKEEQAKSRLLNTLNNTLWDDNEYLKKLRPLWGELTKLSYKIIENEFYSSNSLNVLTYEIEEILNTAKPNLTILKNDFKQIKEDLNIIKRNKDLDIREVDYMIIDSIPLISANSIKKIYKPFLDDDENLWANILAAIKFYPEQLIFISDEEVDQNKIYRIRNFLKNKRLQKSLDIKVISYEEMQRYSKEDSVVDLTLNSHVDAKRVELSGMDFVEYMGSNKWYGSYEALNFYNYKSSLTVDETFFLNNARIHDNGSLSSITRFTNYYSTFWKTYLSLDSDDWVDFVKALKHSENYYILNLDQYKHEKSHSLIEVGDFIFRRQDYKKYISLKHLLDEMVKEEILIDYNYPLNPGKLKLHSYNDKMSKDIGDFISRNMWEYNEGFELYKQELVDENYGYTYSIVSDKLNFNYEYPSNNPKELASKLNLTMKNIDAKNDGTCTRVFNNIDKKDYAKANESSLELTYEFGDTAFREFFSKFNEKGSILRVYTYFELLKYQDFFDDIKLRVFLRWKAYDDYREDSLPIENVLDIVCTKGFSTLIISAVEGKIKNEDLYEINNHTKQFGMDTKPVLIATNSDDDTSQVKMIAQAAGVYFIDRNMIKENGIADYIKNIASGKKDWQKV